MLHTVSYEKYKEATSKWVSWICATADNNGSQTRFNPRFDGHSYHVTTQEIRRQADYLYELNKNEGITYTMPRDVFRAYKSAFAARKRYAMRHAHDEEQHEKNEGHEYFNTLMDDVQKQLRHCVEVQSVARVAQDADAEDAKIPEMPENLFHNLEVFDLETDIEDYEERYDNLPYDSKTEYEPVFSPNYEHSMRMFCLRSLEYTIFQHLRQLWDDTKKSTDSTIVSFITEAAVAIIGHGEDEATKELEDSGEIGYAGTAMEVGEGLFNAYVPLKAIWERRVGLGKRYRIPLLPLTSRHPGETFGLDLDEKEDKDLFNILLQSEAILATFMMDLYLECAMREDVWEKEPMKVKGLKQPLLPTSLDQVSRTLQKVNNGAELSYLQTAFAGKIILFTSHRFSTITDMKNLYKRHIAHLKQIVNHAKLHRDHDALMNQWRTVLKWVNAWPIEAGRITANKQISPEEEKMLQGSILPSSDLDFLRKANPTLCGKLALTLQVLHEEVGLAMLNQSPHVYSMSYLYKTLKAKGILKPEAVMYDIEQVCEWHGSEMFGSLDFSSSAGHISKVFQLQAGASLTNFSSNRPTGMATQSGNRRYWTIQTSDTIQYLRDYFHGNTTLLQMLYKFDQKMTRDMAKSENRPGQPKDEAEIKSIEDSEQPKDGRKFDGKHNEKSKKQSNVEVSLLEADPLAYVTRLQSYLEEALPRLQFPYMTVHCACQDIFKELSEKVGRISPVAPPQDWTEPNSYSHLLTYAVLRTIQEVLENEQSLTKKVLDAAIEVISKYCADGGSGFAN